MDFHRFPTHCEAVSGLEVHVHISDSFRNRVPIRKKVYYLSRVAVAGPVQLAVAGNFSGHGVPPFATLILGDFFSFVTV